MHLIPMLQTKARGSFGSPHSTQRLVRLRVKWSSGLQYPKFSVLGGAGDTVDDRILYHLINIQMYPTTRIYILLVYKVYINSGRISTISSSTFRVAGLQSRGAEPPAERVSGLGSTT